ncbi:MAG TPA: polysaccharide deacetylase family protein, partial [Candidatus Binatus sp.]|nr:polysaccharide deacetylase family protein [Candidatus Binatus sp.]
AFFLLSRLEELVVPERDAHDRFPSARSALAAADAVDRPLADEYVDLLGAAMQAVWPDIELPAPTLRIQPSHDVDAAWAAFELPARELPLTLAGDWRRVGARMAKARLCSWLRSRRGRPIGDPFDTYDFLMDTSERHGLRSTFYFMAVNDPASLDGRYRIEDPILARVLRRIRDRGHRVGLHGGYDSYRSASRLRDELARLVAACRRAGVEQADWPIRQHYLRFSYPETWRAQEAVGIHDDSTLGWADTVGLRAGTAHPYQVFDVLERRVLRLVEHPLAVMDATLFSYLHLDPSAAAHRAMDLVTACRPFGGEAVVLYHNSYPIGPLERAHYRTLIGGLVGQGTRG